MYIIKIQQQNKNKKKEYILYKINPNNGSRIKNKNRERRGKQFYNTENIHLPIVTCVLGCGRKGSGGGGREMVVMGEIRWKLKVMFLNNDTLNTIEAQYGSKTEDIIHQFELFLSTAQLFIKNHGMRKL